MITSLGEGYGERFPTSHLVRYGRTRSTIKDLQDPYRQEMKYRFEDAFRADPTVRVGLTLKTQFILGKRGKTVLDVAKEFALEEERKKALDAVMNNAEYKGLKTYVDATNRRVKLHSKLKAAIIQSKVGGRSALFVEKYGAANPLGVPAGTPADLKVLNWTRLGDVQVNQATWKLEAVQYTELEKPDDFMPAEDIIYFTNADFHITPNSLYYGLSQIEPIAHVSETNRIIDELDLKEINASLWAGFGIMKFGTKNDAEISKIMRDFKPGRFLGTNLDVQVEVHQIAHDVDKLVEERNENTKRIAAALQMPSFLMGFEDVTNRATTVSILHAWEDSVLEDERTWLRDILEPQWYDTLTMIYFGENDLEKIEVKIKQEFESITLESRSETATAMLPLYLNGVIPIGKLLELLGMEDVKEQMEQEEEERKKLALQMEAEKERVRIEAEMNNQNQQQQTDDQEQQPGSEDQTNQDQEQPQSDETDSKQQSQRQKQKLQKPAPKAATVDNSSSSFVTTLSELGNKQFLTVDEQIKLSIAQSKKKVMDAILNKVEAEQF